jgi:CRISPR-associated endoribonuclease Cas6
MRIACSIKAEKIPVAYRMAIVSFIKECLRLSDETYYNKLYGGPKQVTKPFTFSTYLKNYRYVEDEIHLDELMVTFSSPDWEFAFHLYNGMQKITRFQYKEYTFFRRRIQMLNENTVNSRSAIFKTRSPIIIEDENKKPIYPHDPSFSHHFSYIADVILREYRGRGLQEPLIIKPLTMKKTVIKETNRDFEAQHGSHTYLFFTGFQGRLQLEGHPEDLHLLYQLGVSKRRNQGFGQLELVRG